MSTVVMKLEKVLATTYHLMVKTHQCHWNVEGPNFKALHDMFQEQYEELFQAVDEIAERLRALGSAAPAGLTKFASLSALEDEDNFLSAKDMLKMLQKDHETLLKTLKEAEDVADNEDDIGTEDMMVTRVQVHEKTLWMLKSVQAPK